MSPRRAFEGQMDVLLGNGDAEVKIDPFEKRICPNCDATAAIIAADIKYSAVLSCGEGPDEIGVNQQSMLINLARQKMRELRVPGSGPEFGAHPMGYDSARNIDDVDGNAGHRTMS
jgi:hypothetical protein